MFKRRWLLTPVLGAALLFGACSGGDDSDDEATPLPTGGEASATASTSGSATPGASASPDASASPGSGESPAAGESATPGTSASTTPAASSRTPSLNADFASDPCTVMSDEEVLSIVGGAVLNAQGVADRVQPFCRWLLDAAGQEEPAIQDMVIASIGNTALFDNPGAPNKVQIEGLGDAAYVVPVAGAATSTTFDLWVREGPKTLQIQFQVTDPRFETNADFRNAYNIRAQEIAEALARLALERI